MLMGSATNMNGTMDAFCLQSSADRSYERLMGDTTDANNNQAGPHPNSTAAGYHGQQYPHQPQYVSQNGSSQATTAAVTLKVSSTKHHSVSNNPGNHSINVASKRGMLIEYLPSKFDDV